MGKSTLFNRLIGERRAIVDELAGLTRDCLYGVTDWRGRTFTVIDTAGLTSHKVTEGTDMAELAKETQEQARAAISDADVCCLVVDVRDGLTPVDRDVASELRRSGKPVVLVGNKSDSHLEPYLSHELYELGLGEPIMISALQGKNTGDMLDAVLDKLPPPWEEEEGSDLALRIAIVGRPNVGKSSLLNALTGGKRSLVSAVPGTTRDSVDTDVTFDDQRIRLVDTAGIRRRGVVSSAVEHFSLLRSLRALDRSDIGVLVLDMSDGVTAQDRHIAGYAVDAGKGLVIVANKWDLLSIEEREDQTFRTRMARDFDFIPGAPVITASALTGRHLEGVLRAGLDVNKARTRRVPTPALNDCLRDAIAKHPPPTHKGRRLKVLYVTQAATPTPTFVFFVNEPDIFHWGYQRFLINQIRDRFGYAGCPMRVVARRRREVKT